MAGFPGRRDAEKNTNRIDLEILLHAHLKKHVAAVPAQPKLVVNISSSPIFPSSTFISLLSIAQSFNLSILSCASDSQAGQFRPRAPSPVRARSLLPRPRHRQLPTHRRRLIVLFDTQRFSLRVRSNFPRALAQRPLVTAAARQLPRHRALLVGTRRSPTLPRVALRATAPTELVYASFGGVLA